METSPELEAGIDPHRARVALCAIEIITQASGGSWPQTAQDCADLTRRYGLVVRLVQPGHLPEGPHLRRRVIYVEEQATETLLPIIVHEVAEYLLRGEEEPPYLLPAPDGDDYHECARLVEKHGPNPHRLRQAAQ